MVAFLPFILLTLMPHRLCKTSRKWMMCHTFPTQHGRVVATRWVT